MPRVSYKETKPKTVLTTVRAPMISSQMVFPNDDYNIDKKRTWFLTRCRLCFSNLLGWITVGTQIELVGYKMKDAVQQLNEKYYNRRKKKERKGRRWNYQKAADTFEGIGTITGILRGWENSWPCIHSNLKYADLYYIAGEIKRALVSTLLQRCSMLTNHPCFLLRSQILMLLSLLYFSESNWMSFKRSEMNWILNIFLLFEMNTKTKYY